jgi:hypothetical protein
MNAHDLAAFVWLIQEDVVRPNEFPVRKYFNSDAEDPAFVDCEGVRILDFEGCDAGAGTVEAFLVVCELFLGEIEDSLV